MNTPANSWSDADAGDSGKPLDHPTEGISMTEETTQPAEQTAMEQADQPINPAESVYEAEIAPLLAALGDKCRELNFPALVAIGTPPDTAPFTVRLTVLPTREGLIPNVFSSAAYAMGAQGPHADDVIAETPQ